MQTSKQRTIHCNGNAQDHLWVDMQISDLAISKVQLFATVNIEKEVGGFFIGPQPVKQKNGRYLTIITDVLLAKHTDSGRLEVTFTHETWRHFQDQRMEMYPSFCTTGWFHTHVDVGIFYSGYDKSLHEGFFDLPYMIGLVLDPVRKEMDFFVWDFAHRIHQIGFCQPDWVKENWSSNEYP
jgi:hypothetical protein